MDSHKQNAHLLHVQDVETELLLEAIFRVYGYDFRNYNRAHIKRRIVQRQNQMGLDSISAFQHLLLRDKEVMKQVLKDLSINVTEMFRDPPFYESMRKEVVPVLKTYPYIKTWHAGCSTGEEVYSFAILLKEEGLDKRTQIYATDFNPAALEVARKGIYPISRMKEYTANYQKSGGTQSFSDYFIAKYDAAILDQSLRHNIVFAEHNLVTDSVFAEVNLIICRNVLIYFDKQLQNKVLQMFSESLTKNGYLGLGSKESLMFSAVKDEFEVVDAEQKIYRKKIQSAG
ncbi:MAG: protein-glutamate O-methyltransferase CheR [Bacteroidales bacterium]|nr:protein-glutamate O-methyltransferase CheR [Bacteroidales bacterium]